MSQAGIINFNSQIVIPGDVPTQFTALTSGGSPTTAVPSGNNINFDAEVNNSNSATGFTASASGSTVTYTLTNRFNVAATFSDTNPHVLYTQVLSAAPTSYLFVWDLIILNTTSGLLSAYSIRIPLRTNGSIAQIIQPIDNYTCDEGAMSGLVVASTPVGNSYEISVTGYNTDVIDYNLSGYYIEVS